MASPSSALSGLNLEDAGLSLTRDVQFWFEKIAMIKGLDGRETRVKRTNVMQKRVCEAYRRCQLEQKPCFIIGLKPRQTGLSTICEAIMYHHLRRHESLNGTLMGDVDATSDKVFEMFRRYAETDVYPWADGFQRFLGSEKDSNLTDEITLGNKSKYWKETAGSKNAGRGGTLQALHMDEGAHFPIVTGKDPTLGILNSVFVSPKTLVFATSTANGMSGWFYETWSNPRNDWIKIFAAWFEFPEFRMEFGGEEERASFAASMDEDEKQEMALYNVSLEQLKWRRWAIENKCGGDVNKFRQEFPSDDQTAFLLSSRPRFNPVSLRRMRVETTAMNKDGRLGSLVPQNIQDRHAKQVSFRSDSGAGAEGVRIWEEPRFGCRYVLGGDTCSGKDQQIAGGTTADPDWHSFQVWRAAYYHPATSTWHRAKMVAHHHSQIESDVLADIAAAMSFYYGGCLAVIELNNGAGFYLVKELVRRRVNMYRRTPSRMQKPGMKTEDERLEAYGWNTDPATKRWLIESVVPLVRDEAIELSDLLIQSEFETFIQNKKGGSEAMPGKKDDCVMGAALALYNIGAATEFRPQHLSSVDIMRLNRDQRYLAPKGWKRE